RPAHGRRQRLRRPSIQLSHLQTVSEGSENHVWSRACGGASRYLRPSTAVTKPCQTTVRSQIGYETASALSNRRRKFNTASDIVLDGPIKRMSLRDPGIAVPVNGHQPQSRRQSDVGEHFQRSAFIVEQRLGHTEQHADDTVLASRTAHSTVVAVDLHRAHLVVLSIGVVRTLSTGTDKSRSVRVATGNCRRCSLPSAHGPARLRGWCGGTPLASWGPTRLWGPTGLRHGFRLAARDHLRR